MTDPFAQKKQRQQFLIIGGALGLVVILAVGFFLYTRSQQTGIIIVDGDANLTITLNGRAAATEKISSGYHIPLYAGQYRLRIEKPGFAAFQQDVLTIPGSELTVRPVFPILPTSQSAAGATINYVRLSPDQKIVYYLGDSRQRLYRYNVDSQVTIPLTDRALSGVQDVQWSSDPNIALITQSDGIYLHEIPRFDFENQLYTKVAGPEVVSPVWDPNDTTRIAAALITAGGERSLVLANKQFTTIRRLASLGNLPQPKIIWSPNSDYILLFGRSSVPTQNNAWLYKLADGSLIQITTNGGITDASFTPDSSGIALESTGLQLYSIADAKLNTLQAKGPLSHIAWRDSQSFYRANPDNHSLTLQSLDGSSMQIPIDLPNIEPIQGMFSFSDGQKIIFFSATAVYTVGVGR